MRSVSNRFTFFILSGANAAAARASLKISIEISFRVTLSVRVPELEPEPRGYGDQRQGEPTRICQTPTHAREPHLVERLAGHFGAHDAMPEAERDVRSDHDDQERQRQLPDQEPA